jgi:hypothetical protein
MTTLLWQHKQWVRNNKEQADNSSILWLLSALSCAIHYEATIGALCAPRTTHNIEMAVWLRNTNTIIRTATSKNHHSAHIRLQPSYKRMMHCWAVCTNTFLDTMCALGAQVSVHPVLMSRRDSKTSHRLSTCLLLMPEQASSQMHACWLLQL